MFMPSLGEIDGSARSVSKQRIRSGRKKSTDALSPWVRDGSAFPEISDGYGPIRKKSAGLPCQGVSNGYALSVGKRQVCSALKKATGMLDP